MKGIRIKILDLGYMEMEKQELISGGGSGITQSPITAVLIQHPEAGWLLYDTGNDDAWETTYPAHVRETFRIKRLITIRQALAAEGLEPRDISRLVLSHLHLDHVGGLKFFQGTPAGRQVIVAEEEARDAFYRVNLTPDGIDGVYVRRLFCGLEGIGFSPMRGERELAEGIMLFTQDSHTAALIGMRVELEETGLVLFCGDTVYTRESYEKQLPPGGELNSSSQRFLDNLNRLKQEAERTHASIFFGHDARQAAEWQAKGWIS